MLRVLILDSERLIGASILRLLAYDGEFDLFGTSSRNTEELLKEIDSAGIDVVVMDQYVQPETPFELFSRLTPTLDIMIVLVDHVDNTITIYQRDQLTIIDSHNLGDVIRDRSESINRRRNEDHEMKSNSR